MTFKTKVNLIKIYASIVLIVLIVLVLDINNVQAESFNFDEYKAVPWGDIVNNGTATFFCYGYPPGTFGDQIHAKCVRIDDKKFQRCSLTNSIRCEKEI